MTDTAISDAAQSAAIAAAHRAMYGSEKCSWLGCDASRRVADSVLAAAVPFIREAIAAEVEAYCRPRLDRSGYDDGYDCCGCSTYKQIVDDAARIIRSDGAQ